MGTNWQMNSSRWNVPGDGLSELEMADLTLLAEGLGRDERARYWLDLSSAVASFSEGRHTLEIPAGSVDAEGFECAFCGDEQEGLCFLVCATGARAAAAICARCAHLAPVVARRLAPPLRVDLSHPARVALACRYPSEAPGPPIGAGADDIEDDEPMWLPPPDDELAPEGSAADEIDWESHDYE